MELNNACESMRTTDIKIDDLTLKYSFANPIRSKMFNFIKFVSNLDIKAFFSTNYIFSYNFADPGLIDKDHQHIVTADLRIAGNNKLRMLFTMGTKFREIDNTSWEKAKSATIEGLKD